MTRRRRHRRPGSPAVRRTWSTRRRRAPPRRPPCRSHRSRTMAPCWPWRSSRRATVGNSWDDPGRFGYIYVVERLGRADADGFITGVESGRALTHAERASVEAALAPRTVQWIESWNVVDERATTTLPEDRAIITVAEPLVEDRLEVATELWCGDTCGIGSTSVLQAVTQRGLGRHRSARRLHLLTRHQQPRSFAKLSPRRRARRDATPTCSALTSLRYRAHGEMGRGTTSPGVNQYRVGTRRR